MDEKIIDKLKEIIEEIIEEEVEVTTNSNLTEDLGIDSVGIVELITKIEEVFQIKFNDEDLLVEKFETVKSLVYYIQNLLE